MLGDAAGDSQSLLPVQAERGCQYHLSLPPAITRRAGSPWLHRGCQRNRECVCVCVSLSLSLSALVLYPVVAVVNQFGAADFSLRAVRSASQPVICPVKYHCWYEALWVIQVLCMVGNEQNNTNLK